MKKYLFLLLLFAVYVVLLTKKQTAPVFMNDSDENRVKTITLRFKTGVNSNDLVNEFNTHKNGYLIKIIKTRNEQYDVKCSNLDKCVKNIFEQEDDGFSMKYIINGFKITEITFLSDGLY